MSSPSNESLIGIKKPESIPPRTIIFDLDLTLCQLPHHQDVVPATVYLNAQVSLNGFDFSAVMLVDDVGIVHGYCARQ